MSAPAPTTPPARFTLRQLPLPAKLVLSCFLLSVGLGYSSAMVQLHMQHSDRDGAALPTPQNVVAVFSGKVWRTPDDGGPRVVSRLEAMISGPQKGSLTAVNMAPAFFDKDEADYRKTAKEHPEQVPQLDAKRDGERRAVIAWANAAPEARKKAYTDNEFSLPKELAGQPISDAYKAKPGVVRIKYILRDRCARCHQPGGEKGDVPLTTYEEVAKFMPVAVAVPPGGGYVDSGKQISLEKLTQSTHAHLLSFAMLFALTGLTFAFTSYPAVFRGFLGPVVLVAQMADVSCWWLARLPESGPYFAMAILGTGAVVGTGLILQILLSLFNMYGPKGKVVVAGLLLIAGGAGGLAYLNVIDPYLKGEKAKAAAKAEAGKKADQKKDAAPVIEQKKDSPPVKDQVVENNGKGKITPPQPGPSRMERMLTGKWDPNGPWPKNGTAPDGAMIRAFFDKDTDFKDAMKDKDMNPQARKTFEAMVAEREGELAAMRAWVKAAPDARKKAFEDDKFPLPAEMKDKPMTADFVADATRAVKIKSLMDTRCFTCHAGDAKVKLDSYEDLEKYLKPEPVTPKK